MMNAKRCALSLAVSILLMGTAPMTYAAADAAAPAVVVDAATTQAIDAAKAAIKQAGAVKGLWRDTEKTLEKAEEAAAAGENAKAQKLAGVAQKEAELGTNQAYLEQAKDMVAKAKADKKMSKSKAGAIADADAAITAHEGKKAYDLISAN